MSGDFSGDREAQALQNIVDGGVQVALHTDDEGNTPDGSFEVTGADLPRAEASADDFGVSGEAPTTMTNTNRIDFETAEADIGEVTHFSLWSVDTPETSTVEIDELPSTGHHDITAGENVSIPEETLTISID